MPAQVLFLVILASILHGKAMSLPIFLIAKVVVV